ncbi:MAG: peptide deformylase 1 [Lysobacteraceae bacterium]|nr:MAG: peptide deformylase 1 [Xanthomonadaceae bacterium]
MSKLNILIFPDSRLRTKAQTIEQVDDEVRQLANDMLETMYDAAGIGLAATQVDVHRRLLVADVSSEGSEPLVLINPEIIEKQGEQLHDEGCLSVPGIYAQVARAEKIRVSALNLDGEPFETEAEGLLAICIQHEMDHLNGVLFVDYLSPLKKRLVRKKLLKMKRANEEVLA